MFKTIETGTGKALSDIAPDTVFCCEADPPEHSRYYTPTATRISRKATWWREKRTPLCRFLFCTFVIKSCDTLFSSRFHFCTNLYVTPEFSKMRKRQDTRPEWRALRGESYTRRSPFSRKDFKAKVKVLWEMASGLRTCQSCSLGNEGLN